MPTRPSPPRRKTIDGVKNVSIVMGGLASSMDASVEFAGNGNIFNQWMLNNALRTETESSSKRISTYDTKARHTIAIAPIRSLCNTKDMAPRHPHFDNSSPHFVLEGKRLAVESESVVFVNPISDMEYRFELCSHCRDRIHHFPSGSRLQ